MYQYLRSGRTWYHHQTIIPSQMPPGVALEGDKRIDDTGVDKHPVRLEVLIHDGITWYDVLSDRRWMMVWCWTVGYYVKLLTYFLSYGMSDRTLTWRDHINERSVSEVRQLLLLAIEQNEVERGCFCYFFSLPYIILSYILQPSSKASKPEGQRGCCQFLSIWQQLSLLNPLVEAVLMVVKSLKSEFFIN